MKYSTIRRHHRALKLLRFLRSAAGKVKSWLRYLSPSRLMKRMDWYIIKKFIGTYIYAIILIISIAIVFDINENLAKFSQYNAPLKAIVFDYYVNFVPFYANLFSPLFVFIAVIFFTSKLAGNSEIIAMLASGMSFKRLLAPYMDINMSETWSLKKNFPAAVLPTLGFDKLLNNHQYITLAVPLSVVIAVCIWVLLTKTKMGFELRATGLNKNAARYCGMRDRFNIVLTMAIAGGLAGMGASMYYLTDMIKWPMAVTAVPAMGFNGIAAAFLGGLHPIGAIFSSFFIQHITDGGSFMEKIYPAEIAGLISAVIIYMCAFVLFFKQQMNKDRRSGKKGGKAS